MTAWDKRPAPHTSAHRPPSQIHKQVAFQHAVVQLAFFVRLFAEGALELGVGGQHGDIDPSAVELARHNAQLAEVDELVRFSVDDATRFHWGGLYGRVVTNPPYGDVRKRSGSGRGPGFWR